MNLKIINPPATLWDTKSDTAYPALLKYGYDVYAEIGDETNQSKWIYVILANGVSQEIDVPVGYAFSHTVKTNAGFSNTGAKIDWVNGDAGLQAIATAYSIPNPATFQELKDLDLSAIPESDFRYFINKAGTVITNIIAQPYQQFLDLDGNPVYTQDDKEFWVIKTF